MAELGKLVVLPNGQRLTIQSVETSDNQVVIALSGYATKDYPIHDAIDDVWRLYENKVCVCGHKRSQHALRLFTGDIEPNGPCGFADCRGFLAAGPNE
jgi:hypothetical protein